MSTSSFTDKEFGEIEVHRIKGRGSLSLRVTPARKLRITMPPLTPLFMAKRLVESSRVGVRALLAQHPSMVYTDGMQIGKSHTLQAHAGQQLSTKRIDRILHVTVPHDQSIENQSVQAAIRSEVIKILKREASHYLPKRLEYLANKFGYSYTTVRFSHASSRWGSCSSNGTISLNIALMMLPFECIDYVLIHELCHTKEMNHSERFWARVAECDPEYKQHRKRVKSYTPTI